MGRAPAAPAPGGADVARAANGERPSRTTVGPADDGSARVSDVAGAVRAEFGARAGMPAVRG
ncbi:hypothetical protein [Streptomyces sp. NPDC046859]|uniref:hypothetical protein n=1 Tax=Streptomyces sp. NPDC046859 TaxID=3155734 RepID=UPI0033DD30D5